MSLLIHDLVSLLSNLINCRSFTPDSFDLITRSFLIEKIPLVKVEGGYRSIINEKYQIFSLNSEISHKHSWYRVNGNKTDLDIYQTCNLILSFDEKTINQYIWKFFPETKLRENLVSNNNDLISILTKNNLEIIVNKSRLLNITSKTDNYKISLNSYDFSSQSLDYLLRVISTGEIKYEEKLRNHDLFILSQVFSELGFSWS